MGEGGARRRYRAFVSYSRPDADVARRLHGRLEGYVLPRRLVGRVTAAGEVPRRLAPVFRDRDEFAAAGDLTAEVRAALAASASLIVVCSPSARASRWVEREIELFRSLHPARPVVAALVGGEPGDAFPAALRRQGDHDAAEEPLAADFRPTGDGRRSALLKLIAGVLALPLDELIQRDAQRRMRRVTAVTASSVAVALAMGLLAAAAFEARAEAERQRAEAEGLVEFMLTDLRDRLEGVGRLDVLTAVNSRALRHYEDQELEGLPAESLERRARILHAMGEDDLKRGALIGALGQFLEARRTTAALLDAEPDNPDRMWAHGQSEFWVGYVAYEHGDVEEARRAFGAYRGLAARLVEREPGRPKYLREAGYAEGNLCSLALEKLADAEAAVRSCTAGLAYMERASRGGRIDAALARDLANRHAWLADALKARGDLAGARTHRLAEERILARLIAADPKDMGLKQSWVALQRALAALELRAGERPDAHTRLMRARDTLDVMVVHDPANAQWAAQRRQLDKDLAAAEAVASTGAGRDAAENPT